MDIEKIYLNRKKKFESFKDKLISYYGKISNIRLALFLIAVIFIIFFTYKKQYIISFAVFTVFLILFVILIIIHIKTNKVLTTVKSMIEVNNNSVSRLTGKWNDFPDRGDIFFNKNHPYTYDLDIFGENSLFQFLSCCNTKKGRETLAKLLSCTPKNKNEILKRQEAVCELSRRKSFVQRFIASGMINKEDYIQKEDIFLFFEKTYGIKNFSNRVFLIILQSITIITVVLYFLSIINFYLPVFLLIVQFILTRLYNKKRLVYFKEFCIFKDEIKALENMMRVLEKTKFKSSCLNEINSLMNIEKPSFNLKKLSGLADSINSIYNPFHVIINTLLFWDYHCLYSLEKWKKDYGKKVKSWSDTVGYIEALVSLSVINSDIENTCTPMFSEEKNIIKAENLSHLLLFKKGVRNPLNIGFSENVLLITGSNMSGKSTYLRTAGLSLVLAYAGTNVPASSFCCSIMKIYTCMRTSDDLANNISSFYAELQRIKMIVDTSKESNDIIFLLDEIFKGTNSQDRHTGAKALIKKLLAAGCTGLVSTHDLELASLESEESGRIKNYHFEEFYRDNQIFFDYKLLQGVSKTRNAAYLMKMAGI